MGTLSDLIDKHPTLCEELPLIHTSRGEHLNTIVSTGTLEPRPCAVFSESLLYFFYGRPAYRSERGSQPGEPIPLCPVCFVFKPRTLSMRSKRVFPCDTGAVAAGRFEPHLRSSDIPELELTKQIESAQKMVSLFFDNNSKYFLGRIIAGKTLPAGQIETRFYDLQNQAGPAGFDDRKSAIELHVDHPATLKDQLLFVVLPRDFLEDPAIRRAILFDWNCDPIGYPTFAGSAPNEYYAVVREQVAKRFLDATRINL